MTTSQQPPADGASGTPGAPSAPAVPPQAGSADLASENGVAKKNTAARKPAPASQHAPAEDSASVAPVLRREQPPASQLDFDDRHDTRATESDDMWKRYASLRKDRRKTEWHRLAMGLVGVVVMVALYLTAFVVVSHLLPHLAPHEVMKIVALAFLAAGGGVGAVAGHQALARRSRNRGRGPKSG